MPEIEEANETKEELKDPYDWTPPEDDEYIAPEAESESEDDGAEEEEEAAKPEASPKAKDDDESSKDDAGLDADLLSRAEQLGYTETEARELGEDKLLAELRILDRRAKSLGERALAPSTGDEKKETPPAAKPKPKGEDDATDDDDFPELDPEEYGKEVAAFVKKASAQLKTKDREVSELRKEVESIRAAMRENESAATESMIDGFFDSLGDEWSETFGKGSMRSLGKTEFSDNRNKVVREANAIAIGYSQMDPPIPIGDPRKLLERVKKQLFADIEKKVAGKKKSEAVGERRKKWTPSPGGGKNNGASKGQGGREARALNTIKKFMRKAQGDLPVSPENDGI